MRNKALLLIALALGSSGQVLAQYQPIDVSKGGKLEKIVLADVWKTAQGMHEVLVIPSPYISDFRKVLSPVAKYRIEEDSNLAIFDFGNGTLTINFWVDRGTLRSVIIGNLDEQADVWTFQTEDFPTLIRTFYRQSVGINSVEFSIVNAVPLGKYEMSAEARMVDQKTGYLMGSSLRCDVDMRTGLITHMWFPRPPKIRRPAALASVGNSRGMAADAIDRLAGWKNVIVELNSDPELMIPALGSYPHELKQKHIDHVKSRTAMAVRFGVITRILNEGTPEETQEKCAVWADAETGETLALGLFRDYTMGGSEDIPRIHRFQWSGDAAWSVGEVSGVIRPTTLGSAPVGKLVRLGRGTEQVTAVFDPAQGLVGIEAHGSWRLGRPDAALLAVLRTAPEIVAGAKFGG
jgi:hypothetical protein